MRYINEKPLTPDSIEQEELDKWQIDSMTCTISIKGSIELESALPLKGVTDLKVMLTLLKERYALKGWNLKNQYLTEYNTLQVKYFDSISAFID
jgi:hypothetical protein